MALSSPLLTICVPSPTHTSFTGFKAVVLALGEWTVLISFLELLLAFCQDV